MHTIIGGYLSYINLKIFQHRGLDLSNWIKVPKLGSKPQFILFLIVGEIGTTRSHSVSFSIWIAL